MPWKTVTLEVGKDLQLDPPNEEAVIRIVPAAFMPQEHMKAVMEAVKALNDAKPDDNDPLASFVVFEHLRPVMHIMVASWSLLDPSSEERRPLLMDQFKMLPLEFLMRIVNGVMGDTGEIPLVSKSPSENSSSDQATGLTSPAESNASDKSQRSVGLLTSLSAPLIEPEPAVNFPV